MAKTVKPDPVSIGPSIPDTARELLADWAAGQTRDATEWQVDRRGKNTYGACLQKGYLVKAKTKDEIGTLYKVFVLRRTDLQVPVRVYRRMKPNSVFPWTLPEHWMLIIDSPLAAQRKMFDDMIDKGDPDNFDRDKWRDAGIKRLEIRETYPEIKSKAMLGNVRKVLDAIVREGNPDLRVLRLTLMPLLGSPERIGKTLVMLLLKPVIKNRRIIRFDPMSHEEQMDHMDLARSDKTFNERMVDFYEEQAARKATEAAQRATARMTDEEHNKNLT